MSGNPVKPGMPYEAPKTQSGLNQKPPCRTEATLLVAWTAPFGWRGCRCCQAATAQRLERQEA
jgi:hypothetical protein